MMTNEIARICLVSGYSHSDPNAEILTRFYLNIYMKSQNVYERPKQLVIALAICTFRASVIGLRDPTGQLGDKQSNAHRFAIPARGEIFAGFAQLIFAANIWQSYAYS